MLTTLKGKILSNVNKIINSGADEPQHSPKIDLDAGSELLTHFQKQWVELHQINEENASSALKVADIIENLHENVNKDHSNITEIINLLNGTRFDVVLESCRIQLENLYESFKKTEDALIELEDVIEEHELKQRMIDHTQQLEMYRETKRVNYEKLKSDLESQHNISEEVILQERQQVFQEAFNHDLETFKSLGTLPKIETRAQRGALLEEIQLDLDQQDLEKFLEDD